MVPHQTDDENKLLIRCPGCSQRFKVQEEFRERMVECGVCEHRFHIREDVIVRVRKFYPGEKRHHGLSRFQRIPHAQSVSTPLSASALHDDAPPVAHFEPVPPQRIIAGFLGVFAMLVIALVLIFSTGHGGLLDGVETGRRVFMAGFTALLGMSLLLYANPHTRASALLIGGVFAAALVSLPFIFTQGSRPLDELDAASLPPVREIETTVEADEETDELNQMRERIGLRPLEQEIERLAAEDSPLKAYGLSLIGLQESNRIAVRDYMFRVASADPLSHIYPREQGNYLFVLTGLDMNIERLAALARPLGQVRTIVPEIHIVEIIIDNDVFVEITSDKLIRRDDPDFYELNLLELSSIDLHRIQRAVLRLVEAEPRMFRADITRRLRELLDEPGVDFHGDIARALGTWDEDAAGASEIAAQTAIRLHERGQRPSVELVALALEHPTEAMVPVLVALWRENVLMWENHCIRLGRIIEPAMLREFESGDGSIRHSAVRILSRTGGEKSGQALHAALDGADRELEVIIKQALETIAARLDAGE